MPPSGEEASAVRNSCAMLALPSGKAEYALRHAPALQPFSTLYRKSLWSSPQTVLPPPFPLSVKALGIRTCGQACHHQSLVFV